MTPFEHALGFVGVKESSPNSGPQIDDWLRFVKLNPEHGAYQWCAAFVCSMCNDGGRPLPYATASVLRLIDKNYRLRVDTPETGDILAHLEGPHGHCGFFARTDGDLWVSVEGNTNGAGSREGDRVAIKTRSPEYWNGGILRPPVPSVA